MKYFNLTSLDKFSLLVVIFIFILGGCSHRTETHAKLSQDALSVGIQVKTDVRTLKVNEQVNVAVNVRNNGKGVIPALGKPDGSSYRVFVTYHWLKSNKENYVWDGVRTPLSEDIGPNKSSDIHMVLRSPDQPGEYFLEIDLVQEGVVWFASAGSQTAQMLFSVVK